MVVKGVGVEMLRSCCLLLSACCLSAFAGPYEDLQPQPKHVVAADGFCADVAKVTVKTARVEDAPRELAAEAYRLLIAPEGVTIVAEDKRGERYARATLAQLVKLSDGKVPCATLVDWPTFRWRGLMHDCGRNYLAMGAIRDILDMMAAYKLNLFHWHITDYYGWRLESKKYPMLQAPWAFRRQLMKYYTQGDFREIVDYAAARGITVMPEIDVPGHSLSFRRGLGIEFMGDAKVVGIVGDLIDELCTLATAEEMPFVHLGTDEARTVYEYVRDDVCSKWAERVAKNGRTTVGWAPGKPMEASIPPVQMMWHRNIEPKGPAFDSSGLYFGSLDPFTVLNVATYLKPCRWEVDAANKLGAIMCSWHDDYLGEDTYALFRNEAFFPAMVACSDLLWNSRETDEPEFFSNLPDVGTPSFVRAQELERRMLAQRDRVLKGFRHPFAFVKQTDMRWRISDTAGKVLAKDVAQGTVYVWADSSPTCRSKGFFGEKTGTVVLETWIRSPKDQTVGAWIGFTGYARSGGRCRGFPAAGEWTPGGKVTVEVNGAVVPPPAWAHADCAGKPDVTHPEEPTSSFYTELPFAGEEYFMREPTPLALRAGWNHVKLTVGRNRTRYGERWMATFVPVAGTSDHPREVEGLEYSSEPR